MTPPTDTISMRRALRLAERARGRTSPNPPVGAVVVRDGSVVGEGFHEGPGRPHAEVVALDEAGERARGATLYVTLAPCTRWGRTPPCAQRVLGSGISALVVGTPDPNPAEPDDALAPYAAAGIAVRVGILADECRTLIAGFAKWVRTAKPVVTAKVAQTIDGRVAAADGSSKWITGPASRRDGHRLRARADAVMVGIGTVLADDPQLTCRLRGYKGRQPLRVVLDSSGRLPLDAKILDGAAGTLVATTKKAPDEAVAQLRDRGAEVVRFPARDGRVDVVAVLDELGRRESLDVLVEGGPTIVGELVERALVDRYVFYVAPKLLGPVGIGSIAGLVAANVADARELTITNVQRTGADVRIEAEPRR